MPARRWASATLHAQDIRGSAWFDDITVAQVPRVRLTTQVAGNVFRPGDAPLLDVSLSDRSRKISWRS